MLYLALSDISVHTHFAKHENNTLRLCQFLLDIFSSIPQKWLTNGNGKNNQNKK